MHPMWKTQHGRKLKPVTPVRKRGDACKILILNFGASSVTPGALDAFFYLRIGLRHQKFHKSNNMVTSRPNRH